MQFSETPIPGAFVISLEPIVDDRGFFARTWCERELAARGLCTRVVQCNIGYSKRRGTLRGIHFQKAPHEEVKIVRCTRGGVFDVIVDLRPESPTYGQYHGIELRADEHRMLYIPAGLGHGYQALEDGTEMFYQSSEFYYPECSDGLRYNDPALGIRWPTEVTSITERDLQWPDLARPATAR